MRLPRAFCGNLGRPAVSEAPALKYHGPGRLSDPGLSGQAGRRSLLARLLVAGSVPRRPAFALLWTRPPTVLRRRLTAGKCIRASSRT
jgi:hypothetical protein